MTPDVKKQRRSKMDKAISTQPKDDKSMDIDSPSQEKDKKNNKKRRSIITKANVKEYFSKN